MKSTKQERIEDSSIPSFEEIWQRIPQLKGIPLPHSRGANIITAVYSDKITRKSSLENESDISIKKFRDVYDALIRKGFISHKDIKTLVKKRCATCIVSVFEQLRIPCIEKVETPHIGLRLKIKNK